MPLIPQHPGVYWAALDDSDRVEEVALLRVAYYPGMSSFDDGAFVHFVDDTGRYFTMKTIDQEIVRPGHDAASANGPSTSYHDEVRITWLGEVTPPVSFPEAEDSVDALEPFRS